VADKQPDWHSIAEKFDIWLPQLAPVGEVLIKAFAPKQGDNILDIASGTGEPALTLARDMGGKVEIIGVDAADGMVQVAQAKVKKENLPHIRFECMPAEALTFTDNSFDGVICRFGVMLFEDPLEGMREIHRVLKPGGRFALTVWSTPGTMPTLYWSYEAFKNRVPDEDLPPLVKVTSLGGVGVLGNLIEQAGFTNFTIEDEIFNYEFDSFEAYWDAIETSDILKQQFDALYDTDRDKVRDEVRRFASDFTRDGQLRIPHEYLLASGIK